MSTKTLPGADCGSDHQLLVCKIKLRLKKKSKTKRPIRLNMQEITDNYTIEMKNRFSVLEIGDRYPNEIWEEMKELILKEADENVPKNKKKGKAKWLSDNAIKIANERRCAKILQKQEHKQLIAEFQKKAREDKELFSMYNVSYWIIVEQRLKTSLQDQEVTGKFKPKVGVLKSIDGKDLTKETEIKERWKNYTEGLYQRDVNLTKTFMVTEYEDEPTILESEVRWALNKLANGKAPGVDNIPIELLKAVGDEGVKVLTGICQSIWVAKIWSEKWKQSVFGR